MGNGMGEWNGMGVGGWRLGLWIVCVWSVRDCGFLLNDLGYGGVCWECQRLGSVVGIREGVGSL